MRRGQRHDDRRQVRHEHRHDLRRLVDVGGQVRVSALVQRDQQHRHHSGRDQPRPHDRHDLGGLGPADEPRNRVAHRNPQGGRRQLRVRHVCEHRNDAAERERRHRRLRPRSARERSPRDRTPGPTLRRRTTEPTSGSSSTEPSPVRRQRPARSRPRPGAEHRRQHHLGRVLRRPDRRGAHLQPSADAGRDPDRHDPEHRHARHDRARSPRDALGERRHRHRHAQLDGRDATTSASPATTSTAARPPASRRAPPTGSPSRPARATRDTGLAAGTYYYRVTAEDAAGNVGPPRTRRTRPPRRHDRRRAPPRR